MAETFVISDTHFGHKGICEFTCDDGSPVRPWDNTDEMDEDMVKWWNETVGPKDKVYHLGDVVINRRALKTMSRLNGDKVLIKGNHDIFRINEYLEHFRDIRAYHVMHKVIMSHIPVHAESKGRFIANIHGHTHTNRVTKRSWFRRVPDPWYVCVCVEQTNFRPISLDLIYQQIRESK